MSYLADVKMPDREPEQIEVREYEQDRETEEENPNFIYDEEDEEGVEEEQELLPPPPEKKVKLKKEDIFKPKSAPPKKVAPPPEPVLAMQEPIVPKIAPVQKKKRIMSEAQKEALKKGREKRMANKKPKAEPLKETVVAPPVGAPSPVPAPRPAQAEPKQTTQKYYDKDELAELVFQGVQRYDSMRKERKEQKKKSTQQANHDNKVFKDINNAISRQSDPWADCFRM